MSNPKNNLPSFIEAWRISLSSSWEICRCGQEFGSEDAAYGANPPYYSILRIHGIDYVEQCDCWHKEAQRVADWLEANRDRVAKFYQLEKKRLSQIGSEYPEVEVNSE